MAKSSNLNVSMRIKKIIWNVVGGSGQFRGAQQHNTIRVFQTTNQRQYSLRHSIKICISHQTVGVITYSATGLFISLGNDIYGEQKRYQQKSDKRGPDMTL